jgi:hypothetical protein
MLQSAAASTLTLFARASTATCTLLWLIFGGDLSNVILGNMCNVSARSYRVMLTNVNAAMLRLSVDAVTTAHSTVLLSQMSLCRLPPLKESHTHHRHKQYLQRSILLLLLSYKS